MANRKMRNVPINIPISNPQFGVQPVVYYPSNSFLDSGRQAPRQRPRLQYHSSDVSDFSRRSHVVYSANPPSPSSPEFANHLRYQRPPDSPRIMRPTSASKVHLIEQLVDRQDSIRKQMKDTISGWKIAVKDIPKPGRKISVDDQMKRIRALCADVDHHLHRWKDEIHRLTGIRINTAAPSPGTRQNDMKQTPFKQMVVNDTRSKELNMEKSVQDTKKENIHLREKMAGLEEDLRKVIQEKEELLTRLSEISGSRLTDGNVQFTDLNTQNRPTKIAERFQELYNDEWMAALDVLPQDDPLSEKKSISTLLYIIQSSFEFCENESREMTRRLTSAVFGDGKDNIQLNDESKRLIQQLQKSTADLMTPGVAQKFCQSLDIDENFEHPLPESVKTFAAECAKITWCMVVQSPPMRIVCGGSHGKKFDRNMFSEYTQQGEVLDFVVWPAVLIENGGALLSKGVVQPLKPS
ncbi:uncharacterized protein LOC133173019 [Saccostrea echinata]|uniref:uncharacterized protein LOC133173019 n=1 Tax=Saccostrea echinata TaxID=191078 RepID=UPI002A82600E|nr:uncharacterized protein LOC133173019 [Saccostrea echinata]XP_061163882.1 uncharacterized protein LOC133173019 [Saccostrea echinata]